MIPVTDNAMGIAGDVAGDWAVAAVGDEEYPETVPPKAPTDLLPTV